MSGPSAFYEALGSGHFRSTSAVEGPWDPRLAHGSPPATLLAHCIEQSLPRPDARIARIAFDFLGAVPVGEVTTSAEIVRPGARVELCRATLAAGGRPAMVATAWRISTAADRAPAVPDRRPPPPLPAEAADTLFLNVPFGYGDALEWRFIEGSPVELGPAAVYARPRLPLLAGQPLAGLGRLLIIVDAANGISAELPPRDYTFVPVELTVSVWRHPRTEWVGMRAQTMIEPDGVGHTRTELFDQEGYLGTALQTLFVAPSSPRKSADG